ncbi:MAG TPA: glycoside hydrolase family 2 TIM barrel-domain containing protein [Saprospiraceae bacterium]|nr:glycosidase [Saprospiraceae bacterium]MCB9328605.1 glycosidase [Lewinellaceae bacterium]HRX29057.1 glycoside hydrolase family 2 TIM barrel-domain containing protein [Saprospiraceae bacterium]
MRTLIFLCFLLFSYYSNTFSQSNQIYVKNDNSGYSLMVNDQPFFINGMNWDYFPRGYNYSYSLWNQPDDIIMAALEEEMSLLKNMGVNVIRQYTGVPARWITYIFQKYGIYTLLNHSFGRYGLTLDGTWVANTEYSDPRARELLIAETKNMVMEYKDTPGVLMFLLGNENNYGLFWEGAETEDIPLEDRKSTIRARALYKLFNEAVVEMKSIDSSHPIAICNGDLLFLDIIAEECKDIDVLGANMYRGKTFTDAFTRVRAEFNKPFMLTEFGADAFNAQSNQEDQQAQAYYLVENWRDIYKNAAGMGGAQNTIGGFTFQFSDGWWKYGQTSNLDVHDNNASWSNGGYESDYVEGENNMNEEWFGICAKGPNNARGLYQLYPRAAYFALQKVHQFNLSSSVKNRTVVDDYFDSISIMDAVLEARGENAALEGLQSQKLSISRLSAEFTTFNTGGNLISTPKEPDPDKENYPDKLGFDHMQSFYVGIAANPSPSLRANVEFNVVANVATNPIDQIFYENRARPVTVATPSNGPTTLRDVNRVQVYRADFSWNHKQFDINGFYRTGHYHWGYEGDFFGLYPEANYGPNIDIYNGQAPLGIELNGKRNFKGFSLALGPELWWGANPAALLKYSKQIGKFNFTGMFHEDLEQRSTAVSSFAIPTPKTRRATLYAKTKLGKLGVELGGIWGGQPLVGRAFMITGGEAGNYTVYEDKIKNSDTWGGKIKLMLSSGRVNWYAQGSIMGLVANGGGDYTQTYTGWKLKDSGSGNQYNILSGFTYYAGNLQIAPNFLWQKPIVGPMPSDVNAPGRPRNILSDPFAVRSNRETVAGEILFTYDPTPATWMYEWDNDRAEDAKFAMNLGFVYRHLPTSQDAAIGILGDGRTIFAFPGAAPAHDLWEIHSRIVSKVNPNLGLIANIYAGTAQANGSDKRTINRSGIDFRMIYNSMKVITGVKLNDWGPYDYHRDFNLTYPQQLVLDISTSLGNPSWFELPTTSLGVRGTYRTLDQYSPRYCPTHNIDASGVHVCDPTAPGYDNGNEWEIRTYVKLNIFK